MGRRGGRGGQSIEFFFLSQYIRFAEGQKPSRWPIQLLKYPWLSVWGLGPQGPFNKCPILATCVSVAVLETLRIKRGICVFLGTEERQEACPFKGSAGLGGKMVAGLVLFWSCTSRVVHQCLWA